MAKNGFKVMDSDMHITEPPDLWQRYIDPTFKDRAPKLVNRYPGDGEVEVEGHRMASDPKAMIDAKAEKLSDIYRDPVDSNWDAASQVRAMDKEGIDVAFLYPTTGLSVLAVEGLDSGLGAAIAMAYNDWMYDFCSHLPGRLLGSAMISPFDVKSAVAEVNRATNELGFKADSLVKTRFEEVPAL